MTSNTLWTQRMLSIQNILISWLRDHTHSGSSATTLNRLSPRQSKTTPSKPLSHLCFLFFLPSSPFSFSALIHLLFVFRHWNDRLHQRQGCRTCLFQSRSSRALVMDSHPICCNWCSPLGPLIWPVSTRFKINETSCPYKMQWLDFCSILDLCCIHYHYIVIIQVFSWNI